MNKEHHTQIFKWIRTGIDLFQEIHIFTHDVRIQFSVGSFVLLSSLILALHTYEMNSVEEEIVKIIKIYVWRNFVYSRYSTSFGYRFSCVRMCFANDYVKKAHNKPYRK